MRLRVLFCIFLCLVQVNESREHLNEYVSERKCLCVYVYVCAFDPPCCTQQFAAQTSWAEVAANGPLSSTQAPDLNPKP